MDKIILADWSGREVGAVHPDGSVTGPQPFLELPPAGNFAELLRFMEGPSMPEVPMVGGGELLATLNHLRREPPGPLLLNELESYWSYGGGRVQYLRPNLMTVRDGWIQSDETLLNDTPYGPGDIFVEGVTRDVPGYPRVQFRIMNLPTTPPPAYSGGEMYGYTNYPTERPSGRRQHRRWTRKELAELEDNELPYSASPDGDGTEYLHGDPI